MNTKLYQNGKFYRLYFLPSFWCLKLHVGDLWFILSVKALNKNTALCHSVGNRIFFPFSLCRVLHTYWIYSSSNYEIWGYRAIIDCHHMPVKLLSDGTMSWLEIPFCWSCHISECAGLEEHRRLSFSLWGRDTSRHCHRIITSGSLDLGNWGLPTQACLTHLNFHHGVKKRGFPSGVHVLQGIVRFWFIG